jgi:flavodoxin
MKSLVVYDTQFGNTERVAQAIAGALAEFGQAQALRVNAPGALDLKGVDLLVLGSPILGWKPSEGMQAYLDRIVPGTLIGAAVACFDTRMRMPRFLTGSAVDLMDGRMQSKGVKSILKSQVFLVKGRQGPLFDGELEKAAAWAKELAGQVKH